MITRADVVAEARRWLGTPYQHQARLRGVGADCGGLIGGVAVALGVVPANWWQTTFDPLFGGYSRQPHDGALRRICELFLDPVPTAAAQPGDVLLMHFGNEPQHVGILANYRHDGLSIVHALNNARRIAEHRLAPEWRARAVAAFSYPGVQP